MSSEKNRKRILFQPVFILAILFFQQTLHSQITLKKDTLIKVTKGSFIRSGNIRKFLQKDTILQVSGTLTPSLSLREDKTIAFYDSLKSKASRNIFTQALYDLVIVKPDSSDKKKSITNSLENFRDYSGKKIRKIQLVGLNVFGSDINYPGYFNPNKTEKLLNKTHVNTNENIIRKYLLFSEGDTLSPLIMSDNERILRQLPFIDDARIIVVPVSGQEADILVVTKDVYSLGAGYSYRAKTSGTVSVFDKNIFGIGHELDIDVPYSTGIPESPGIGLTYKVNNIAKSFINLSLIYYHALGTRKYGLSLSKDLISYTTKYAGGISVLRTFTTIGLGPMIQSQPQVAPLNVTFQDYWIMRSFLIDKESVTRIMTGIRYTGNNPYDKPEIAENSNHELQEYKLIMSSVAMSIQKYYKTSLLYSYGRTEDVPYGMLLRISGGYEINEFKRRPYSGLDLSFGHSFEKLGYFYSSTGVGTYFNGKQTEQGVFLFRVKYFSNLVYLGSYKIRNFVNFDYTRGFDRYSDEYLVIPKVNGFSGLSNDHLRGGQRIVLSLESVIFSPKSIIGFKYAIFGFTDMAYLKGTRQSAYTGGFLSGIGVGLRIRNDNLVFNTFQIRIGFFPDPPLYSRIENVIFSGEQLLRPANLVPGAPSIIPYQ